MKKKRNLTKKFETINSNRPLFNFLNLLASWGERIRRTCCIKVDNPKHLNSWEMLVYIKATLKISGTPTVRGISKALHPSRGGRASAAAASFLPEGRNVKPLWTHGDSPALVSFSILTSSLLCKSDSSANLYQTLSSTLTWMTYSLTRASWLLLWEEAMQWVGGQSGLSAAATSAAEPPQVGASMASAQEQVFNAYLAMCIT